MKWGKRETYSGDENGVLERECLSLSRIVGDPIVGSIRDKKESCSTRRGFRVGTRFKELPQTP